MVWAVCGRGASGLRHGDCARRGAHEHTRPSVRLFVSAFDVTAFAFVYTFQKMKISLCTPTDQAALDGSSICDSKMRAGHRTVGFQLCPCFLRLGFTRNTERRASDVFLSSVQLGFCPGNGRPAGFGRRSYRSIGVGSGCQSSSRIFEASQCFEFRKCSSTSRGSDDEWVAKALNCQESRTCVYWCSCSRGDQP